MKTLGVYGYVLRGVDYDMPFVEMILSVEPIADEICIVTDPRFKDGTLDKLNDLAEKYPKLKVFPIELDLDNPAIDGATKALARSKCKSELLLQMDADEVVNEKDYRKIQKVRDEWPESCKIMAAGVINWFNGEHIKTDGGGHSKERFSINDPNITHGIPMKYRGKHGNYYYAISEQTDGAGYIDQNGNPLVANVFLSNPFEIPHDLKNKKALYISHYSWYSIPRKWEMKQTWHYFWGLLYGKYKSLSDYKVNLDGEVVDFWGAVPRRFPASYIKPITEEMQCSGIIKCSRRYHPETMSDWLARQRVYVPRNLRKFERGYERNMKIDSSFHL